MPATKLVSRIVLVMALSAGMLLPGSHESWHASATDADSTYGYIALNEVVTHPVKHLNRLQDTADRYLNAWETTDSDQVYRYYRDQRGFWTFERQQVTGLPEPTSQYIERYIWDRPNPEASVWLYPDYLSQDGDISPSGSSPSTCTQTPLQVCGCDYVSPAGQQWLPNITARPDQGTDQSHAILQWDASTFGQNEGHLYYQGGVLRATAQVRLYGQIWKRNNWSNDVFRAYPDAVNTAEEIGWRDPGISGDTEVRLAPRYLYILRQYSGCDMQYSDVPWHACERFEDHLYAKDANNKQLGEVMVVAGFTPRHDNWYRTVGDYWAVIHVMIAKQ